MDSELEQYLSQFTGQQVIYIPNPGNAGDSVIAAATYQIFERLGIHYEMPRFNEFDPTGRIVIYGGGGNLVSPHTFSARVVGACHKRAKRLSILPHTVKNIPSILGALNSNVDVICRETLSYDYVTSNAPSANVYLMDDVAFSLDIDELRSIGVTNNFTARLANYSFKKLFSRSNIPALANVLKTRNIAKRETQLLSLIADDELYCFRTDGERTDIPLPDTNVDLSEFFMCGVETKDVAFLSTRMTFSFLSKFRRIHTNRLHMAISSALLGLDVKFYSNNYYKCRAVYEHSMQERYKNVTWMG